SVTLRSAVAAAGQVVDGQLGGSVHCCLGEPEWLDYLEHPSRFLELVECLVEDVAELLVVGTEGKGAAPELLLAVDDRDEALGRLEAVEFGDLGLDGRA